jgi:hypothetical protein
MPNDLPTARSMLPQDSWLCLSVRCRSCLHRALADLQAIIDAGRGDVPVKDLKFRCTRCGSRLTDSVVTSRDAQRVRPWGSDGAESDSTSPVSRRWREPIS